MDLSAGTELELLEYLLHLLSKPGPISRKDKKQLALINQEFKRRDEEEECQKEIEASQST